MHQVIDPTAQSVKLLAEKVPSGIPVVMLNLLRFKSVAQYTPDKQQSERSGRAAYAAYGAAIQPYLKQAGGKVIWQGAAKHAFIAPPGEEWDEVLLVEYPSKEAFLAMVTSPGYQAITFHRAAALEDARLIVTVREMAER
jgi:uncharacterized protein (DUF1330 family)